MRPIWNPGAFQSAAVKKPFFEGWYYKLVSKNCKEALAIIPGIAVGRERKSAFLQIYDGTSLDYRFIPYPLPLFTPVAGRFDFTLGDHHFSDKEVRLSHRDCSLTLDGRIEIDALSPWPVRLLSPGAMGWYGLLPVMENYHGVLSMDSPVNGSLRIDSKRYNFDGGRCYIEKDWGSGFPSAWIWLQCNHFEQEGVSLTFSLAKIPWHGKWFSGFIIGLLLKGKLYQFCTYSGARFEELRLLPNGHSGGSGGGGGSGGSSEADGEYPGFEAVIRSGPFFGKGRYILQLQVLGGPKRALQAPIEGAMRSSVEESLSARCRITLKEKASAGKGMQTLFEGEGERAGLEISGDLNELIGNLIL